jgi:hypothetical protein
VKILGVAANNRRKAFHLLTVGGRYDFPFAQLRVKPTPEDKVVEVYADPEAGYEAFTYRLESGMEDTVHLDAVLEFHQDPGLLNEMLLHRLTVEARSAVEGSGLSKRELARSLGTSPAQLYRLLDPTYYGKSLGQMAALLRLLGKDVEVVVSDRAMTPVHPPPEASLGSSPKPQ